MDTNDILLWIAGISLTLTALQGSRTHGRELVGVAISIAGLIAVVYAVLPDYAGYVAFGLYALIILLPALGSIAFQNAIDRRRWRIVAMLGVALRVVRPTPAMRLFTAMGESTARAERGDLGGAERLLRAVSVGPGAAQRAIEVWRLHLAQRWEELLTFVDAVDPRERAAEPVLGMYRLRALGELGRMDELARAYGTLESSGALAHPRVRHLVWVTVLAFGGRRVGLQRLLTRHPSTAHADRATFWLATASWAAGDEAGARAELADLEQRAGPAIRAAIAHRLAHPPAVAVDGPLWDLAGRMERVVTTMPPPPGRPWVTIGLVCVNLVMFVITVAWRHERALALYALGAFEPSAVQRGDWWRLVSCLFLHANSVHLIMNMAGLYLLGRALEPRIGRVRFAVLYLACGLAGTWMSFALYVADPSQQILLVGASGCVMGLVGALGIIAFRDWRSGAASRRQIEAIVLMIVLQIAFDATHPHVSSIAHMVGLGAGALLAAGIRFPRVA